MPRFKVDDTGQEIPAPRAAASIIYDPETNQVLFEENAQKLRSIASITKVMTALVFLETLPDLGAGREDRAHRRGPRSTDLPARRLRP